MVHGEHVDFVLAYESKDDSIRWGNDFAHPNIRDLGHDAAPLGKLGNPFSGGYEPGEDD